MSTFTTRPDIRGRFGVVASSHWIASAVGMGVLERGGNAFDAAAATGFALQVVEPHLNGPGGDLPALVRIAETGEVRALCAQGVAPAAATPEAFAALGLSDIPGTGLLASVVPGAFDGWMLMARDLGRLEVAEILAPAIELARDGHPLLPRVAADIAAGAPFFRQHWPTSAATWLPDGTPPAPWSLFRNPDLAATYQRIADEAVGATRAARFDAARSAWSEGFVAEAIGAFLDTACVMDVTGTAHRALLSRDDLRAWRATWEAPVSVDHHGWEVFKCGPWTQGPALLQVLRLLEADDLAALPEEAFVHRVTEAIKLAFADREAFYGDPDHSAIPLDTLLSPAYAAERRALIADTASLAQRPGALPGHEAEAAAAIARFARRPPDTQGPGAGEPTMAHLLVDKPGDTVHLDVIDRWGNVVSATPSGGWLQSSPVVPGLGFPLNTRMQMFWLDDVSPSRLIPGARPRTTLTPTLARGPDGAWLSCGTPGGDQQDQWQAIWLLRHIHRGLGLAANMDAPLWHTLHVQGSFDPRIATPGELVIEPAVGTAVLDALRARGHRVTLAEPWTVGRLSAALRQADGTLIAAATPRLMQAYAVGR